MCCANGTRSRKQQRTNDEAIPHRKKGIPIQGSDPKERVATDGIATDGVQTAALI